VSERDAESTGDPAAESTPPLNVAVFASGGCSNTVLMTCGGSAYW
jgi:hypothetical protein